MKRYKVLIYSDAAVYGGHEATLLHGIESIAEIANIEIVCIASLSNRRFLEKLDELQNKIEIIRVEYESRPGDVFRAIIRNSTVRDIRELLEFHQPDLIVVSQGAIGLSACGLRAAQLSGALVVSFLPMAHPVHLVRGKNTIDVMLQERLYAWLYTLPDYFLTICNSSADWLQSSYDIDPTNILISHYGLDVESVPEICYQFRPDRDKRWRIGLIGRVELLQKRHDFFFNEIIKHPLKDMFDIYVIGDGPDLEECRKLVTELGLAEQVSFTGWSNNLKKWYDNLDLIVMPSRFEGVPLVLLEAMLFGVPVVASDIDGMKELLPEHWLFPEGDGGQMRLCLTEVLNTNQKDYIDRNREIILEKRNITMYKRSFRSNILYLLDLSEKEKR